MKQIDAVDGFLHFSRKERLGIIVLASLLLFSFFLPSLWPGGNSTKRANTDTTWMAAIKKLEQTEIADNHQKNDRDFTPKSFAHSPASHNDKYAKRPKPELFYFDPNLLPAEGWKKLGLRDKTIHTILSYLSKGGHFKKQDDLQKIYGLFPDEYERIAAYINIAPTVDAEKYKKPTVNTPVESQHIPFDRRQGPALIDINLADTTAYISLPGIGSKLAARIINFRDKLGGFYAIAQIGETYGLPDSTFQKIKKYLSLGNTQLKKININTASADALKAHPYIRYILANPIIAYRNEHGRFEKLEDVRKVMAVTEEAYQKIVPYLSLQ